MRSWMTPCGWLYLVVSLTFALFSAKGSDRSNSRDHFQRNGTRARIGFLSSGRHLSENVHLKRMNWKLELKKTYHQGRRNGQQWSNGQNHQCQFPSLIKAQRKASQKLSKELNGLKKKNSCSKRIGFCFFCAHLSRFISQSVADFDQIACQPRIDLVGTFLVEPGDFLAQNGAHVVTSNAIAGKRGWEKKNEWIITFVVVQSTSNTWFEPKTGKIKKNTKKINQSMIECN